MLVGLSPEVSPHAVGREAKRLNGAVSPAPVTASSLPATFFERAKRHGTRVALRRKKLGLWQELSWAEYEASVRAVASGLIELGVRPAEPVGLISENRVEWLMCDLGILSAGAVTCAMYTTSASEQLGYVMRHAAQRVLFAENEEQLDKALEVRKKYPIEWIIVLDEKGLRRFSDPGVMFWDDFLKMGAARRDKNDEELERRLADVKPDDLAILVYTSGTTGPPKGVMLSHHNLEWACRSIREAMNPTPDDEFLSFLPLCHIAERMITVFNQVVNGSVVNFAENLDTVAEDLAQVRPHVFFAVPRIWEKLYNAIELRMRDASFVKRRLYTWAIGVGRSVNDLRQRALREGRDPVAAVSPGLRLAYAAADQAILRHLRKKLGFDRTRFALSGAAPISAEVIGYFQAIGIPLAEGYGQTESTAIISLNPAGASPVGTVGLPVPGLELRIADDGEILARSPGVMLGYYKESEATSTTIDGDGWLHTGDVGEIDDTGRLRITDRKKDLIITSGGKNIAPQYIESKLRCSGFIHDAIVIGERRKYVTTLVILDEDNLFAWAQKNRLQFGTYTELARSSEVRKLVEQEIEKVNQTLSHVEAIKVFRVLERRLDHGDGVLTPTLKVRRKVVEQQFSALIEEMYRS